MASAEHLSDDELEQAQQIGAITFIGAYIRRMTRAINPDHELTMEEMRATIPDFIDPVQRGIEIAWGAWMFDKRFAQERVDELQRYVDNIQDPPDGATRPG